jgi:hypothetical protein
MFGSTALETTSSRRSPSRQREADPSRRTGEPLRDRSAALEIVALVVIALLLVTAVLLTRTPNTGSMDLSYRLRVRSGDSLWTLATSHPVEGLSTAQLADLLAEANGLQGQVLVPGQMIRVPSTKPDERMASR